MAAVTFLSFLALTSTRTAIASGEAVRPRRLGMHPCQPPLQENTGAGRARQSSRGVVRRACRRQKPLIKSLTCGFATPRRRHTSTFSRRHGREHPAFGCLALGARACGASSAGPECVRLRPHPHSVRGQVPRGALERARLPRLWPATSSGEAAGHRDDRSF